MFSHIFQAQYFPHFNVFFLSLLLLLLLLPGGREAGDGVRPLRERPLRVQDPALPDVRVHDQLHPQAQAPPGEVHDEQRAGELHDTAGQEMAGWGWVGDAT